MVSATNDLVNVVDFPVRGRSPVKVEVRDPRHGGDSGSRGRGDSRNRRDVSSCLHYPTSWSRLIQTSFNQLEARRHGSGSRGRGDSRGRRDVSLAIPHAAAPSEAKYVVGGAPSRVWFPWPREQPHPPGREYAHLSVVEHMILSTMDSWRLAAMALVPAAEAIATPAAM